MLRAFIFDLDGTLVDTLDELSSMMNHYLRSKGWPEHPREAYRRMVGRGFRNLIQAAVPPDMAASVDGLYGEAFALYESMGSGSSRPYPGAVEALERLNALGVPVSVVSNKPDALARKVVAELFPSVRFALVRGGLDGVPVKPHPRGALDAARASGAAPADCAFVGDSDVDMATALAAGMVPVGAAWGFRGADELRAAGAALVMESMADVPDLLDAEFRPSSGI